MNFKYEMINTADHVLAAVSGGADSVAMLYALCEIEDIVLSVCHINHNLRGEAALQDAEYVKKLCDNLNLPFFYYSVKVESDGLSLEEAARKIRYDYLYQCAKECGANKIAMGHNQNDNAETIIMRLCRGTGLRGLGGIPPIRDSIIRPLIETPRKDIEAFLNAKNIPYRTDATNFDRVYSRNRIRHDIIPAMEQINPQIVSTLSKSAALFREEEKLLLQLTADIIKGGLHIPTMLKMPSALQKRVIRSALTDFGLRDIEQQHISQIESLLLSETGKETHLPRGIIARREYDYLQLYVQKEEKSGGFCHDIPIDKTVFIPQTGATVRATIISYSTTLVENSINICTKYFNYDRIKDVLQLRTRRPGDRINLSGVGNKKLQDEFSDRKIPRANRDTIPLLATGSEILWIMDNKNRTSGAYIPQPGRQVLAVEVDYERDN